MARSYGSNLIEDEDGNIRPRVPQIIDARAPMHDPAKNRPMSESTLTPAGIWNEMFRNRFTSGPQVSTIPATERVSAFGSGLQSSQAPKPPSLTTMANGTNHAQRWMAPVALNQFSTTPVDAQNIARQYGTGPASTTFDSTPGTRRPFIAGANGANIGPSIAAKVSQNDPTLDRNYVNKSGGVPNLISAMPSIPTRSPDDWRNKFTWSSAFQ